jgi:exonuclease VII small subunit/Mor family transcriptional regulator
VITNDNREKAKNNDLPLNSMQVILNKKEKEQLVIKLYQDGKPIREIARQAHLSFGSIGKIIRTINNSGYDSNSSNCSSNSKSTKALWMFKNGKRPIDIAIELDLSSVEVEELQQEFWALNHLYELAFLFNEIKYYLPSFIKLFHLMKQNKMLNEKNIVKLLRFAGHELPELVNQIQILSGNIIDLEWKKMRAEENVTILNSNILQLRKSLNSYDMTIELKKRILAELDRKINQKMDVLHEKPATDGSVMKQKCK